jgi:esterase/lipase superfamily enzyme/nucleoid DNA-binding protein
VSTKSLMTTDELFSRMAAELRISKSLVRRLFKELASTAISETKRNGVFVLPGLGRLVKTDRKARMGRNPAPGQPIKIRARSIAKFRVDAGFVKQVAQIKYVKKTLFAADVTRAQKERKHGRIALRTQRQRKHKYEVIRIFYATDREAVSGKRLKFGTRRNSSGSLSLGTCDVSIPQSHKAGNIERPSILRLELRENPDKHFVIQSVTTKTDGEFYGELSECVGLSEKKEAFVFIHGFKVSFDDAVYRTAQISHDLQFKGAPILYSWPSNGSLYDYTPDMNNNDWTVDHLVGFLEDLVAKSGATVIHLIAHSMGNRALTSAMKQMSLARMSMKPEFNQVVLTAPDVDASIFTRLASLIGALAHKITLYVSSHDLALMASKKKNGSYPRAGDSSKQVVVVAGVDTVDASAVDTNLIGHFYYAENRSVLSDIFYLFEGGKDPKDRFGMRAVEGPPPYWRFTP